MESEPDIADAQGESLADRVEAVRQRIAAACERAGRRPDEVLLIAVTKTFGPDAIREAVEAGLTVFGENRVQEAAQKIPLCPGRIEWHMIGHLQRNKARHSVEVFSVIHSVDSEALAREIGRRAEAAGKRVDVLVEVRISGEATKFGVEPSEALCLVDRISEVSGIRVCGLMGMAPFVADPEETRPYFSKLKELWDRLPDEQRLYLSMGMTQDFEIAIEEGSNMVRVGTAIFGPRE